MSVSGICAFVRPSARCMTSTSRPALALARRLPNQPLTAPSRTFKSVSAPIVSKPFTKACHTRDFRVVPKPMWGHDFEQALTRAAVEQAQQRDKEDAKMVEMALDPTTYQCESQSSSNHPAIKNIVSFDPASMRIKDVLSSSSTQ